MKLKIVTINVCVETVYNIDIDELMKYESNIIEVKMNSMNMNQI